MPRDQGPHTAGVVLPLRSFSHGKARLAAQLGATRREQLVRDMADRVAGAAAPFDVVVVSSAPEVIAWANARGLRCIDDPGSLDGAAAVGRDDLRDRGFARVVVAHADLPFAQTFEHVAADGAAPIAVIVPCHRDDGTPVLAIPAGVPFEFAYGPGSFARHCAHAAALGLEVRVVRDPALSFDVDVPDDLARVELGIASPSDAPCP
jgi:2-phospho-L-lactate/phosphoenolpyruvate guanylyltransferase